MIDTILFDLDGTLLISDSDKFTSAYMTELGRYMSRLHDPEPLVKAVWAGTKAMVKNDGSRTNEAAFWDTYSSIFGEEARKEEERWRGSEDPGLTVLRGHYEGCQKQGHRILLRCFQHH